MNTTDLIEEIKNLLDEGYYDVTPKHSLISVILNWKKGDKAYDASVHGYYDVLDLVRYKEYARTREGGNRTPKEWDQLKDSLATKGWNPKEPLHFIIYKNGKAKVGEGNHRLAIVYELLNENLTKYRKLFQKIPVQFHFYEGR